jgi:hypothetical protein
MSIAGTTWLMAPAPQVGLFQKQVEAQMSILQASLSGVVGLALLLVLSLGLVAFRPTFRQIVQERNTTLQLFLTIPTSGARRP